jgi:hypothetical protein
MAVAVGYSGALTIDDSSGTPVDVASYVTEMDPAFEKQVFDITTFGSNGSRSKTTGLKDGKVTVRFFNDPTLQTLLIGIWGTAAGTTQTFVYGPQGSTAGKRRVTFETILVNLPIPAKVDAVEEITATFEISGAVTFDTY